MYYHKYFIILYTYVLVYFLSHRRVSHRLNSLSSNTLHCVFPKIKDVLFWNLKTVITIKKLILIQYDYLTRRPY